MRKLVPVITLAPEGNLYYGARVINGKIPVGEKGRGRRLVEVPLPEGAVTDFDEAHDLMSSVVDPRTSIWEEFETLPGRGRVYAVPVSVPGAVAVMHVRDMSGFRGGWSMTFARPWDEWEIIARRWYAHYRDGKKELGTNPGHEGLVKECPVCREKFHVPPRRDMEPVEEYLHVVASGYCAQGDAGYMGGGPEYLLVLREGDAFEIARYGRLYGSPSTYRVEVNNGKVWICDPGRVIEEQMAASRW